MDTILSLDEVNAILAEPRRTRGEYKPVLDTFAKSGDIAMNLTERFPGKVAASLKNSITLNIDKYGKDNEWPTFKVLTAGTKDAPVVVLVNADAHAAAVKAAAEAEANTTEDTNDK